MQAPLHANTISSPLQQHYSSTPACAYAVMAVNHPGTAGLCCSFPCPLKHDSAQVRFGQPSGLKLVLTWRAFHPSVFCCTTHLQIMTTAIVQPEDATCVPCKCPRWAYVVQQRINLTCIMHASSIASCLRLPLQLMGGGTSMHDVICVPSRIRTPVCHKLPQAVV